MATVPAARVTFPLKVIVKVLGVDALFTAVILKESVTPDAPGVAS